MGGDNKFITNKPGILSTNNSIRTVQIGIVASVDDPQALGRIKVKIPGASSTGGDDGTLLDDLPWAYPMVPRFFTSTPKVNEGVFVIIFNDEKSHSDRLYLGPIISQFSNLELDPINTTALSPFTFATLNPVNNYDNIPALDGVFPSVDDVSVQGRYNTDLIFKNNEILMRVGKFTESTPNANNPFPFQFNNSTQGFIQIRNNVPIVSATTNSDQTMGTVTTIVGSKINLITNENGSPRFNVMNQDDQISNDELLNIIDNAHPLAFGDILLQYLRLLKTAFINHVHNNNGLSPTDLLGGKQDVKEFRKNAEKLENLMLSKNIVIN